MTFFLLFFYQPHWMNPYSTDLSVMELCQNNFFWYQFSEAFAIIKPLLHFTVVFGTVIIGVNVGLSLSKRIDAFAFKTCYFLESIANVNP